MRSLLILKIQKIPLYFSLLAGKVGGDEFAADSALRHAVSTSKKFCFPFCRNISNKSPS